MGSVYECSKCSNNNFYNERYDAYMCVICNEWKEGTCEDENCSYCVNRICRPLSEIIHCKILKLYKNSNYIEIEEIISNM
jgi:hypothetical protein